MTRRCRSWTRGKAVSSSSHTTPAQHTQAGNTGCFRQSPEPRLVILWSSRSFYLAHLLIETFTLLPQLPFELRLKIWRHTFPGPRVVKVNSYGIVKEDGYQFHAFYSTSPIPTTLSICTGSRAEVLRLYHPSFGMRYPAIPSIIYFNYDIDMLYFEFDAYQALNSQLLILALPDRYGQIDRKSVV